MSLGLSFAHYRITAKLGEGGVGEFWRATDSKLGREVAIKVLPHRFDQDRDFGIAAHMIRHLLVDYVRACSADKPESGKHCLSLDEAAALPGGPNLDRLDLDDALQYLAHIEDRQRQLRFSAGVPLEKPPKCFRCPSRLPSAIGTASKRGSGASFRGGCPANEL